MTFQDHFLPEFDHEMQTTRSLLEVVPFEHASWAPHAKAQKLGSLASHVANIVGFGTAISKTDGLDFAAPGRPAPATFTNREELLKAFDADVATARAAIAGVSESQMGAKWTLQHGDHVILSLPKAAALRTLLMNHLIHHRGQLSTYLRIQDVKLPSIYGPTADSNAG